MSVDNLDRLSDFELHHKLLENGFPNMPVTETTRQLLIKKLRNHLLSENLRKRRSKVQNSSIRRMDYEGNIRSSGISNDSGGFLPNLNISTTFADTHTKNILNESSSSSCSRNAPQIIERPPLASKMYAPSPIFASESDDDSDHFSFYNSSIRKSILPRNTYRPLSYANFSTSNAAALQNQFDFKAHSKNYCVPYILSFAFTLFLFVLAFMYMVLRPDLANTISEDNTHFRRCDAYEHATAVETTQLELYCIDGAKLTHAIDLNKKLIRLLQERAEYHHCNDHTQSAAVTLPEFVYHLNTNSATDADKLQHNLQELIYIIKTNPQWKIAITQKQPHAAIGHMGESTLLSNQDISFALLQPQLPMKCIIYNKLHQFFFIIGIMALVVLVALCSYALYRYIRGWQNDRAMAIAHYTTEIVNELLDKATLSENPEQRKVIIVHLRDKLVPLNKRNKLLKLWNEALRQLEENDSRIQFSVTIRNGEDYRCMQWVGNGIENQDYKCTKKWQSPAFDSTNKMFSPPTPCLKIRQMFDSTEIHNPNLKQIIEGAILEKVGTRCNICDIQLDNQSCCVYVRCASEKDAGIVHAEINGWWFDKRLVSIKFLRLERYLSRFPALPDQKNNSATLTTAASNGLYLPNHAKERKLTTNAQDSD